MATSNSGGTAGHLHIHALVFSPSSPSSRLINDVSGTLGIDIDRDWLGRNVFATHVHQRWATGLAKRGCGHQARQWLMSGR
jgi:hypothetical protein